MEIIERHNVDLVRTGERLMALRCDNQNLRRYVCSYLKFEVGRSRECSEDCEHCTFEMDHQISRSELAQVMMVSESVIFNWENGRTPIDISSLVLYADMAKIHMSEIIVFEQ